MSFWGQLPNNVDKLVKCYLIDGHGANWVIAPVRYSPSSDVYSKDKLPVFYVEAKISLSKTNLKSTIIGFHLVKQRKISYGKIK